MIQQNTPYTVTFLMVLASDHVTPATGLTPGNWVTISKAGGSFTWTGGIPAEISNGWYSYALTASDTDTPGDLSFHCDPGAIPLVDPTDFREQVIAVLRLA